MTEFLRQTRLHLKSQKFVFESAVLDSHEVAYLRAAGWKHLGGISGWTHPQLGRATVTRTEAISTTKRWLIQIALQEAEDSDL